MGPSRSAPSSAAVNRLPAPAGEVDQRPRRTRDRYVVDVSRSIGAGRRRVDEHADAAHVAVARDRDVERAPQHEPVEAVESRPPSARRPSTARRCRAPGRGGRRAGRAGHRRGGRTLGPTWIEEAALDSATKLVVGRSRRRAPGHGRTIPADLSRPPRGGGCRWSWPAPNHEGVTVTPSIAFCVSDQGDPHLIAHAEARTTPAVGVRRGRGRR